MDLNLEDKIINYIKSNNCSVSMSDLFKQFGTKDKKLVSECISGLLQGAKIIETKKGKLVLPEACGVIPAKIITHARNFLFAKPLCGGEDVYIPVEKSRGALLNDTIIINRVTKTVKGYSGAVWKIVEKGNRVITGTFVKSRRGFEIIADYGYRFSIPVKKGKTMGASTDDKVQAAVYSGKSSNLVLAKVTKIYGESQCARVCTDAIIDKSSIPTIFSSKSIDEAEKFKKNKISQSELKNRLDLRSETIFTIDGSDAKDLDDAISVKKTDIGYQLGVHIADVSHYVKKDSSIDDDAKLRGNSVYFADRVIPMLPEELSNGICSLYSGVDRLAVSAIIDIDKNGKILSFDLKKSVICSKVRGVYSEVNSILNGTATRSILYKYSLVKESLLLAQELYLLLYKKAQKRGNMPIDTTESKFTLNKKGVCINVTRRERGISEKIIEQFMIIANIAVAKFADSKDIPFIYRVHGDPDPEKVLYLANIASSLGFKTNRIKQGVVTSLDLSKLLEEATCTKYKQIISNQVLRTMQKAKYSYEPLGHFGLALKDYCHFTSPIRRYSDLAIHRILSEVLKLKSIEKIQKKYSNFVVEQSLNTSVCEVRAMKAERDTEACYMAEFMSFHIGETFTGKISGVIETGVFVELENSVEGFIGIEYFMNSNFQFDGFMSHVDIVSGKKLTIGDQIKIIVVSSNIATGKIDFMPCN